MSICPHTHKQCVCQPSEGVMCEYGATPMTTSQMSLPERLRLVDPMDNWESIVERCNLAADEIERLSKKCAALALLCYGTPENPKSLLEKNTERTELLECLDQLAQHIRACETLNPKTAASIVEEAAAALRAHEPGGEPTDFRYLYECEKASKAVLQCETDSLKADLHAMTNAPETLEALKTAHQALLEVAHAQDVGPEWYTRGASGLRQQVGMWVRRGLDALNKARPTENR